MDITTLAAWGEFLGGIAVVVSLIYLASQIRQNSRLMQISSTVTLGESDIAICQMLVNDSEISRIFRQGTEDRESLPEAERDRFDAWVDMIMRIFQRSYFIAQDGALKPAIWQGEKRGNAWIIQQPGSRQWWDENRNFYSDEFGSFLDGLIREGEAAG
jgi:hypothetical protein